MLTSDNDCYYNRLCHEVVALRHAMRWFVHSDYALTDPGEATEARSIITQIRHMIDEDDEVNSY